MILNLVSTAERRTNSCNGFYVNLLAYQKANFPSLTNREVGALLVKIDPQLAAMMNISRPENQNMHTKKVHRICLKKKELDSLVLYTPSKYLHASYELIPNNK